MFECAEQTNKHTKVKVALIGFITLMTITC